ncbi:MAG: hypothetical protein CBC13_10905 [Planctomycetia bacterium TMED53]|nr:MAG: hypothetical protein CBC13_10905 [Planctomycetia bacterium TMED53]
MSDVRFERRSTLGRSDREPSPSGAKESAPAVLASSLRSDWPPNQLFAAVIPLGSFQAESVDV